MRHTYLSWAGLASVFLAGCAAVATHERTDAREAATVSSRRLPISQIAVVRSRTGNPPSTEIIVMDPSGRQRHILVPATAHGSVGVAVGHLTWSPDGHWLAFTGVVGRRAKRVEQTTDLFVVRADGSGLRRLTRTGSATEPVWSPDGRTIVFAALTRNVGDAHLITDVAAPLMRVNRDGTDLRELTPLVSGQVDRPGSFSPGGTHLVFTRSNLSALKHSGRIETSIETMGTDGSGLRQLVAGGSDPAYSPMAAESHSSATAIATEPSEPARTNPNMQTSSTSSTPMGPVSTA